MRMVLLVYPFTYKSHVLTDGYFNISDIDVYMHKPTCQSKQTFKFGSEYNRLIPDMVILILWSPPSYVHIDGMGMHLSQLLVETNLCEVSLVPRPDPRVGPGNEGICPLPKESIA